MRNTWVGFGMVAALGLLASGAAGGQVRVEAKFVPRKEAKETAAPDPAKLADVARVSVQADSGAGVERVTFEVDDAFRFEDKMPPYEYDWDTLAENDGEHTLAVTAYNANGQTGVKRIKVKVENRLALGMKHWVGEAFRAFRAGDGRGLERAARKASRLNPADPEAARVMALNLGAKGDVGNAFRLLDDNTINIPKDDPLTQEVRGYVMLVRASNAPDVPAMMADMKGGMEALSLWARRNLASAKDAAPDDAAGADLLIARGDAQLLLFQYDPAYESYAAAGRQAKDAPGRRRAQHRLILALLRGGRLKEAEKAALKLCREADASATSRALYGMAMLAQRQYQAAKDSVADGAKEANAAALVVSALADLGLGARREAYKTVDEALQRYDAAEVYYAAQAVLTANGDPNRARTAFQTAFVRSPFFLPTLVARAFDLMAFDTNPDRFNHAMALSELVLRYEPGNAGAWSAAALAAMNLKRENAAKDALQKLSNAEPNAPDLFVYRAVAASNGGGSSRDAADALARARQLDPVAFPDTKPPGLPELAARLSRFRRVAPLTPGFLDLAEKPIPPKPEKITEAAAR